MVIKNKKNTELRDNIIAKFDEISNFLLGIDSYDRIAEQYYGGFQQVILGE